MPRTKVPKKRTRYQVRLEAEIAERQRLAGVKLDAALQKIDELGKHSKQQVDNQLQLLMARMPQQMLQMKWNDLYKLQLQRFEHFQFKSPAPPPTPRSHSNCSRGRLRTPQSSRSQVQSVDRAGAMLKRDDNLPAFTLLRWPKPGELALSTGGSPLAVQTFPDRCANVHIPTKVGVLKLEAQKLADVKREVLQQLDASTLNQIKTLSSNLHKIVDIATKIQASKK